MIRDIERPRWLKAGVRPRRKGYGPVDVYGADTETIDGKPYTVQLAGPGGFKKLLRVGPKNVTGRFLDALDELDAPAVIFLHNLEFDLAVLFFPFLRAFEDSSFVLRHPFWTAEILYGKINTATITLHNKAKKRKYFLIDTFAFFKSSLAQLAKAFKLPPKLAPPPGLGTKRYTGKEWKAFKDYALRDAETARALGDVIAGFHRDEDIPQAISAPQMAAFIFRKQFLAGPQHIPANPPDVDEAACLSYHGGKNGLYVEPGIYPGMALYDINSAYPHAMTQLPNPDRAEYSWSGNSGGVTDDYLELVGDGKRNADPGVYCLSGISQTKKFNPLRNHAFKPVYGPFRDIWTTGYELQVLLRGKFVHAPSVREAYFLKATMPQNKSPLRLYAENYFRLKAETTGTLREFYKILLNSLYGKFIQNRSDNDLFPLFDGKQKKVKYRAGGLWNPMIATLITGYVRAYLTELEMRYESAHSSTDSILVPLFGRGVATGAQLGQLALKGTGTALLLRPKLYLLWNEEGEIISFALHGFHGTLKQFVQLMRTDGREYVHNRMMKVREAFRQKRVPLVMREFSKRVKLGKLPVQLPPLFYRGERL